MKEVIEKVYGRLTKENMRLREKERKKKFKFIKHYKRFDLYEHKTAKYKECFWRDTYDIR